MLPKCNVPLNRQKAQGKQIIKPSQLQSDNALQHWGGTNDYVVKMGSRVAYQNLFFKIESELMRNGHIVYARRRTDSLYSAAYSSQISEDIIKPNLVNFTFCPLNSV